MRRLMLTLFLAAGCSSSGSPAGLATGDAASPPDAGHGAEVAAALPDAAGAATDGFQRAAEPVAATFTRADHDLCAAWPICPADVFGVYPEVAVGARHQSTTCRAMGGIAAKVGCGPCVRRPSCAIFTGRCMAPITGPSFQSLAPGMGALDTCLHEAPQFTLENAPGFTICTDSVDTDGRFVQGVSAMVCEDSWP